MVNALVTPGRWVLWRLPRQLIAYVLFIQSAGLAVFIASAVTFTPHARDFGIFALALCCGLLSQEVVRLTGVRTPAGVVRDLGSAWTLPLAFLLPPVYAMALVAAHLVHAQIRIRRSRLHRRLFSAAAIGLCNVAAGVLFRTIAARGTHLAYWTQHPTVALIALACGALGIAANGFVVAVAVKLSEPGISFSAAMGDREGRVLEIVEVSAAVMVFVIMLVNPILTLLVLPPVMLLHRSLIHSQLRSQARHDAKTGLLNAGTWNREAEREIGNAGRGRLPVTLLLLDLDHFKRVNDTYGHLFGDQVLQAVASALTGVVRRSDLAGRFGGEEFVLLLPGTALARAQVVAERIHARMAGLAVAPEGASPVPITVSIGISVLGRDGNDLTELLAAADAALYRAKRTGRNRTCLASEAA